jgi:hypothetical protein
MSEQLTQSGWKRTASGRWIHPDAPPIDPISKRRRLFTEAEALTLHDADTTTNRTESTA